MEEGTGVWLEEYEIADHKLWSIIDQELESKVADKVILLTPTMCKRL